MSPPEARNQMNKGTVNP